jgi:uncharacterized surface protein with fasciclin (FAS1) repeats
MRRVQVVLALVLVIGFAVGVAACGTPAAEEPVAEVEQPTVEVVVEQPTVAPPVEPTEEPTEEMAAETVLTALEADGRFSTLLGLLASAGLTETLSAEGPFTVLAPTNDAFAALPEGTLEALDPGEVQALLLKHVLAQRLMAADLPALADTEVEASDGGMLLITIEGDEVMFGKAIVVEPDVEGGNGVIHVIDAVLMDEEEATE